MTTVKIWDGDLALIEELYGKLFDNKFNGDYKEYNISDVIEEALYALKATLK